MFLYKEDIIKVYMTSGILLGALNMTDLLPSLIFKKQKQKKNSLDHLLVKHIFCDHRKKL